MTKDLEGQIDTIATTAGRLWQELERLEKDYKPLRTSRKRAYTLVAALGDVLGDVDAMWQAAKAARDRRAEDEQARRDAIVRLKRIFKEAGLDFKE